MTDMAAATLGSPGAVKKTVLEEHRDYQSWLMYLIIILVMGVAAAGAYRFGWIQLLDVGDSTHMVRYITGLFLVVVAVIGRHSWERSRSLNDLRGGQLREGSKTEEYIDFLASLPDAGSRANCHSALKLKLNGRLGTIMTIYGWLIMLGLIGTVIGFIIAFNGVDPEKAKEVTEIGPMVSFLIGGMRVALYTTLVGAVQYIGCQLAYLNLMRATTSYVTQVILQGESHAALRHSA